MTEHADSQPVPTPARVLLPAPDGLTDPDDDEVFWQLWSSQRVYASLGEAYIPFDDRDIDAIERDALMMLAAVAWARGRGPS